MPDPIRFSPEDFDTGFIDNPSVAEDNHRRKYSSIPMPTSLLYGLVGAESWAPEWVRKGYNQSIEGLAYEWINGSPFFKESPNQNQGMLNDLMSTLMSFATVTDIATFRLGGAVGKLAIGKMMAKNANLGIKAGVSTKTAKKAAQEGAEQWYFLSDKMKLGKEIGMSAVGGATTLGFYEGLHSAASQLATKDDIDFMETLKGVGRGAVTGATIGATGQLFATEAAGKLLKRAPLPSLPFQVDQVIKGMSSKSRHVVGEVAGVGTLPSLESLAMGEPRLPTAEDYIYAAGLVGGLKAQAKIGSAAAKGIARATGKTEYMKKAEDIPIEDVETEKRKFAETTLESEKPLKDAQMEFTTRDGAEQVKITTKNWREKEGNDYITYEILKSSEAGSVGQKGKMRANDFFATYKTQSEGKWLGRNAAQDRAKEIETYSSELKESKKDFALTLQKFGVESLDKADSATTVKIRDHYKDRVTVENFVKDPRLDKEFRLHLMDMTPEGVLKQSLNNTFYARLRRQVAPLKSGLNTVWGKAGMRKLNDADFAHVRLNAQFSKAFEASGLKSLNDTQAKNLSDVMEMTETIVDPKTGKKKEKDLSIGFERVFEGTGKNKKQAKRTIVDPETGKKKTIYAVKDRKGNFLDVDIGQASPNLIRKNLDYMEAMAISLGIPVKGRIEGYIPRLYKFEKIRKMFDDISKVHEEYQGVLGLDMLADKPANSQAVNNVIKKIVETGTTERGVNVSPDLVQYLKMLSRVAEKGGKKDAKDNSYLFAWNHAKKEIFMEKTSTASHLERSRRIEIPDDPEFAEFNKQITERDIRKLLLRYTGQFSKRIAFSQHFGLKGERMQGLIDQLKNNPKEQEALNRAYHAFTGMIELNPNFNYQSTWKNFYANATNFMVATKIGLGLATIPNLTQPLVSIIPKHGFSPFFKASKNLVNNKDFKEKMIDTIGKDQANMLSSMFGVDVSEGGAMARFADKTTTWFGFNKINEFNYKVSAATHYEALKSLQNHAKGNGLGVNRKVRERAIKELEKYGFEVNENIDYKTADAKTRTKVLKSMYEFARDSQLQRNVLKDPYFASNPKFRPFFLFKRFGYRQAEWVGSMMSEEIFKYKNPLPFLRLAAGGAAGGVFVGSAKQMISDVLSGEDIYDPAYSVKMIKENYKKGGMEEVFSQASLGDLMEAYQAVGALGVITDIMGAESKANQMEFIFKPAIFDGLLDTWDTFTTVLTESKEFGLDNALRRSVQKVGPLFGAVPTRAFRRFRTDRQEESFYNSQKSRAKKDALDAILNGNAKLATRAIKEYNGSILSTGSEIYAKYPNIFLTYEDIGPDAIMGRLINRVLKEKDIPQRFVKYLS